MVLSILFMDLGSWGVCFFIWYWFWSWKLGLFIRIYFLQKCYKKKPLLIN